MLKFLKKVNTSCNFPGNPAVFPGKYKNRLPLQPFEDKYLMKKVQDGDFSKLGLLFERHHRDLFGYFYYLTSDRERSEDLVQTVFYRMLKYRKQYKGEGKFAYWMYRIAKNCWHDTNRKKDPMRYADTLANAQHQSAHQQSAQEQMEKSERKQQLHKALLQLSTEKREAIVLSRFQGLKYSEIAALSNCTENAIKSRIQRGLMELKEILQKIEV